MDGASRRSLSTIAVAITAVAGFLVPTTTRAGASPLAATSPTLVSVPDPFAPFDCGVATGQFFRPRNSPREPVVAVDPTDPKNIVVAYIVDGNVTNLIRVTKDGGATWSTETVPGLNACSGGTALGSGDPSLAFSADGSTVYLSSLPTPVWGPSTDAVEISRSLDGGLTWEEPTVVSKPDGLWGDFDFITADPSDPRKAYVLFERHDRWTNEVGARVFFSMTGDRGAHWSDPRVVYVAPPVPLDPALPPTDELVAAPGKVWPIAHGRLMATFRMEVPCPLGLTDPVAGTGIWIGKPCPIAEDNVLYSAVSDDGGLTWSDPARIGRVTAGYGTGGPSCGLMSIDPSVVTTDGSAFIVLSTSHRDLVNDPEHPQAVGLDLYTSRDGVTWSMVGSLAGARMALPTLAAGHDGTLAMTYYQLEGPKCSKPDGSHELMRVWLGISRDRGRSWSQIPIAGPFDPSSDCFFPGTPLESCGIADYDDLTPSGPTGFVAVFEMTSPNPQLQSLDRPDDIFMVKTTQ